MERALSGFLEAPANSCWIPSMAPQKHKFRRTGLWIYIYFFLTSKQPWNLKSRSTCLWIFWMHPLKHLLWSFPLTKGQIGQHHRANIPCQMTQEISEVPLLCINLGEGWKAPISLENVGTYRNTLEKIKSLREPKGCHKCDRSQM